MWITRRAAPRLHREHGSGAARCCEDHELVRAISKVQQMGEKERRQVASSVYSNMEFASIEIQAKIAKALEWVQGGFMNEATAILTEILSVSPNQSAASYISGDIELWRKNYESGVRHGYLTSGCGN
jgi:hypothetical protein